MKLIDNTFPLITFECFMASGDMRDVTITLTTGVSGLPFAALDADFYRLIEQWDENGPWYKTAPFMGYGKSKVHAINALRDLMSNATYYRHSEDQHVVKRFFFGICSSKDTIRTQHRFPVFATSL